MTTPVSYTKSPFRVRTLGRAPSPPTWACYEQIPDDYSEDEDESVGSLSEDNDSYACSEDDEDYEHISVIPSGASEDSHDVSDDSKTKDDDGNGEGAHPHPDSDTTSGHKDIKGKQRAVEPGPPSPKRAPSSKRSKRRQPRGSSLRPILTTQKFQGFLWNQDVFIPPYIKDRYVVSTSPPTGSGFKPSSVSSSSSGFQDYEIDVVEIRVDEDDLNGIIP